MAFLVENAFGGKELVQDANHHPTIRLFTTRKLTAAQPLSELGEDTNQGQWTRGTALVQNMPPAPPEDGAPSASLDRPKGPGRACAPRSAASAAWKLAVA